MKDTIVMKNYTLLIIIFFSFGFVHSQRFKELDKSPLDMIQFPGNRGESQWARILYSRPQLKGREISSLVPEGQVWRMGANESTELTLYLPMKVSGNILPKGSYTLYAIPFENEITIIINKATNVWGAYSYNQDLDIIRVKVPLKEVEESLEAFSMIFDKKESEMVLHMGWGNYRASLSFTK